MAGLRAEGLRGGFSKKMVKFLLGRRSIEKSDFLAMHAPGTQITLFCLSRN